MANRSVMFVQNIDHMQRFIDDDGNLEIEKMRVSLEKKFPVSEGFEWAFIVHDKDLKLKDGELVLDENDIPVKASPHMHFLIRTTNKNGYIGKNEVRDFFKDKRKQSVENVKDYSKSLCYLVHKTFDEKYQYDTKEVYSNFNFPKALEKALKRVEKKAMKEAEKGVLERMIMNEEVDECDVMFRDEYSIQYCFRSSVKKAFEVRDNRRKERAFLEKYGDFNEESCHFKERLDDLKGNEKRVIYIYGSTGTGKSLLCKALAKSLVSSKDGDLDLMNIYTTSDFNDPFEYYHQIKDEEIVILEEFRENMFQIPSLLQLFDNHERLMRIKSRFSNKEIVPKILLVNTPTSPEWMRYIISNNGEGGEQFTRRLSYCFHLKHFEELKDNMQVIKGEKIEYDAFGVEKSRKDIKFYLKDHVDLMKVEVVEPKLAYDHVWKEDKTITFEGEKAQKKSETVEEISEEDENDLPFL